MAQHKVAAFLAQHAEKKSQKRRESPAESFTLSGLGGIYSICTHQTSRLIRFRKRFEHIYESTFEGNWPKSSFLL